MSKAIAEPGLDIAKKTVCVKLSMRKFGDHRQTQAAHVTVLSGKGKTDPDKDMVSVSKRLLDSPELIAVRNFDNVTKRMLLEICLPFEIGIHLLPIPLLEEAETMLKAREAERQDLVHKFLKAYPELIKNAAKRLKGLYNATDYPPVKEVAKDFKFSWQYVSFGVPDKLKGINSAMWEQEREKAAKRMAEAAGEIQLVLRHAMLKLVSHMAERLKSDPDGKPLVFHKTLVSNLTEFLGNFDFRNVTDDAELQKIVSRARQLLDGVDADTLRTTDTMREKMQKEMDKISKELTKMTTRGGRKFRFKEEAAA